MSSECVCGFDPPADPNPDCERCQLVTQRDALLEACEAFVKLWARPWGKTHATAGEQAALDQARAAIAKAKGGEA